MIDRYRTFCEGNPDVPIFMQPWWLDVVCDGASNWDVAMVEKGGNVKGILPFYIKKKQGFSGIGMPPFTPWLGYKIFYPESQKTSRLISYEMEVVNQLLEMIPEFSFTEVHFSPNVTNWLPLYRRKFNQTTRYFYTINDITDTHSVFENFENHTRRAIKKASVNISIEIAEEDKTLYDLLCLTFYKQGLKVPFSYQRLNQLYQKVIERKIGTLFHAKDEKGKSISAALLVKDGKRVYNLIWGNDPQELHSGAMSLIIWQAIKTYSNEGIKEFDFTGSMITPVEHFMRGFGGSLIPYFRITKENSIPYFWLRCANDFKNRFLQK